MDSDKLYLALILEAYFLAAPEHLEILQNQKQFLLRLKAINDTLNLQETRNPDFARRNEIFLENIKRFFGSSTSDNLISITDSSIRIRDMNLRKCGLMKSKKKPQRIFYTNFDSSLDMEKKLKNISFIFKIGDDLRQDKLVIQMLKIFDDIWQKNGLNLQMTTYTVVPTEQDTGILEYVQDAETVCKIQMAESCKNSIHDSFNWMQKATSAFKKNLILQWLNAFNETEEERSRAHENFMLSCCGYTVAMYVLGIGDRHNDNIMIKKDGKVYIHNKEHQ